MAVTRERNATVDTCKYCRKYGRGCTANINVGPDSGLIGFWMCTRSDGHLGKHVACAGKGHHDLYTWEREEATR